MFARDRVRSPAVTITRHITARYSEADNRGGQKVTQHDPQSRIFSTYAKVQSLLCKVAKRFGRQRRHDLWQKRQRFLLESE
jgi:hypothetical protein